MARPPSSRLAVAALLLTVSLAACDKPVAPGASATKQPRAHAAPVERAQRTVQRQEVARQFMRFALNALLVPLLDDDWPPRWADPTLSYDCDALEVQVDDAPLDVGAPVHGGAFTVRWHMERCTPFDGAVMLTGDVELKVEPIGGGYRANVEPAQLHVVSAQGHEVLTQPFTARMGLGR